jgi:hypothetical protein
LKNKIISIGLLAVLIFPWAGSYSWLKFRKAAVRQEVHRTLEQGINRDELVMLTFTKDRAKLLRWEHPGEFEYQGRMYDVVKRSSCGDTLHLLCLSDERETGIKEDLAALAGEAVNHDPQEQPCRDQLVRYLLSLYVIEIPARNIPECLTGRDPVSFFIRKYDPVRLKPPTPPPRPGRA